MGWDPVRVGNGQGLGCGIFPGPMILFCGLGMGFDKPQPFINAAGNLGEEIRRVSVLEFVRFIDRVAGFLAKGG